MSVLLKLHQEKSVLSSTVYQHSCLRTLVRRWKEQGKGLFLIVPCAMVKVAV